MNLQRPSKEKSHREKKRSDRPGLEKNPQVQPERIGSESSRRGGCSSTAFESVFLKDDDGDGD